MKFVVQKIDSEPIPCFFISHEERVFPRSFIARNANWDTSIQEGVWTRAFLLRDSVTLMMESEDQ